MRTLKASYFKLNNFYLIWRSFIINNLKFEPTFLTMGNKTLRPDPTDPFAPFNDDQKSYLKDKF
jgi:hypothetical protein